VTDTLQHLRDRKLVQWALAYIAAAFALIQVVDIVAQRFAWPEAVERYLIVALAVGFFAALVLAWYHGERGAQSVSGTELVILALLLGIGGVVAWRFAVRGDAPRPASASGTAAPAAAADAADPKSIAVLPFVNMSGEAKNEYFSDGITEEILNALAQVPGLKVAARTSAFAFKGKDPDLRKVGDVLDVATVLEGSVQRDGDTVRIIAQLIDARSGYHLWSERYDRQLTSVFAIEDEISKAIADRLELQFGGAASAGKTADPQAHELYLRGLALLAARGPGLREAADLFSKAVAIDPQYAQAWGALAETEQLLPGYVMSVPRAEADARAEAAAQRALAINPDTPAALVAMAEVYMKRMDWTRADTSLRRALALAPSDAEAANQYGQFLLETGQFPQALRQIDRAGELDPLSAVMPVVRAATLMALHRDAEGVAQIEAVLQAHPDFYPALITGALVYLRLDRAADGEALLRHLAQVLSVDAEAKAILARGVADASVRAAAVKSLEQSPANADIRSDQLIHAAMLTLLGERDHAFAELEAYAKQRASSATGLLWTGVFAPLSDDPRYRTLLRAMNLPYRADEPHAP
jgi:TolB-like protein/Tfp pilus assembly protein PilF